MRGLIGKKNLLRVVLLAPIGIAAFSAPATASTTLPPRKPGLWQTTMNMKMNMNGKTMDNGSAPFISAMCSDASTDAMEMKRMTGDTGDCSHFDVEGSGDTYTMDGTCASPMGGGTITTHGVITKESDTAFHVVSQTSSANMSGSMVGDSKWLGACPAGMAPGDFGTMQNGQFVKRGNMLDTPKPPQ